jgi:hypothetical protein
VGIFETQGVTTKRVNETVLLVTLRAAIEEPRHLGQGTLQEIALARVERFSRTQLVA